MSCADVVDRLPDWVAGRLADGEGRALAAHVAGCAACAEEARVVRTLHAARPAVPADLAARIAAALGPGPTRAADMAEMAEMGGRDAEASRPARPRRRGLAPAWALSAAAVLALAVGTSVLREGVDPAPPAADTTGPTLGEGPTAEEGGGGVWIADDALVAGAPVLEEMSDDALAALLEEMGG